MKSKEILNKTPIRGKTSQEKLSDEKRIVAAENELNQSVDLKKTLYATSCLNTEDTGRSMTEMLGTLAVIGVLSVAGIAGYQYAMNYYRANQVVNELNLLRNELQIKMANGNQELILGSPYDTGEEVGEGHLQSNETYGFTYDCGDGNSGVSDCRDETGFYMKVKEVPEEICRPLRRMVENLSGLENLSVNDVEAGDCRENNNIITMAFEADVILDNRDLPADYCRRDEECESAKCRENRCVECDTDSDCGGEQRCDRRGMCIECQSNFDCGGRECIDNMCGDCPPDTPLWNASTGVCEACPAGQEWDATTEACISNKTCISNTDCNTTVNFCKITRYTDSCPGSGLQGNCTAIGNYSSTNVTGIGTVYRSNDYMTWWAAKNWCEALGKNMSPQKNLSLLDISENRLGCYKRGTTTPLTIGLSGTYDFCCASGQSCGTTASLQSQAMQDLRAKWSTGYCWTANDYSSCDAYEINFNTGFVYYYDKSTFNFFALCE